MTFWDQSRENPRADYRNADTVPFVPFAKKLGSVILTLLRLQSSTFGFISLFPYVSLLVLVWLCLQCCLMVCTDAG